MGEPILIEVFFAKRVGADPTLLAIFPSKSMCSHRLALGGRHVGQAGVDPAAIRQCIWRASASALSMGNKPQRKYL